MRRILAALVCFICFSVSICSASALDWPDSASAQPRLRTYIDQVNEDLLSQSAAQINSVFALYDSFASFGVTAWPQSDEPEDVEITVSMFGGLLTKLELRVSDPDKFAGLAAACIHAAAGLLSLTEAARAPQDIVSRVRKNPANSFSDEVNESQGDSVRTYYSYAPNEFHDGVNWLTMTLIFPFDDGIYGMYVETTPPPSSADDEDYQGYLVSDNYSHFEVFTTETPSPDDGIIR